MMTTHAWFSAQIALREGSSIYRKLSGATVNVTRMNASKDARGPFPHDENYVGQVISEEDGGCVRGNWRVPGISD